MLELFVSATAAATLLTAEPRLVLPADAVPIMTRFCSAALLDDTGLGDTAGKINFVSAEVLVGVRSRENGLFLLLFKPSFGEVCDGVTNGEHTLTDI